MPHLLPKLLLTLPVLLAVGLAYLTLERIPQGSPPEAPPPTLRVEMTAYTSDPAQTDATPSLTASSTRTGPGTAALSRDLLARFPYGTKLHVVSVDTEATSCGGWLPETALTVEDTMHPRIANHVDLWVASTEEALRWGRCEAVVEAVP